MVESQEKLQQMLHGSSTIPTLLLLSRAEVAAPPKTHKGTRSLIFPALTVAY